MSGFRLSVDDSAPLPEVDDAPPPLPRSEPAPPDPLFIAYPDASESASERHMVLDHYDFVSLALIVLILASTLMIVCAVARIRLASARSREDASDASSEAVDHDKTE